MPIARVIVLVVWMMIQVPAVMTVTTTCWLLGMPTTKVPIAMSNGMQNNTLLGSNFMQTIIVHPPTPNRY